MRTKPRIRVQSGGSIGVVINMAEYAPEPDETLTIAMDSMQAMIDAGEITGLAIAASRVDGGITTAFVSGDSVFTLIAAIRAVQRRVESGLID